MGKTAQTSEQPDVLTLDEAAAFLRISPRKLWDMCQPKQEADEDNGEADEIPPFRRVGSQYRFLRSKLREYAAGKRQVT